MNSGFGGIYQKLEIVLVLYNNKSIKMQVEFITKQDLQELKREIFAEMRSLVKSNTTEIEWLRTKQTCELLNCSTGTLKNWRIDGLLPFRKVRGSNYYSRKDILKMLEGNKVNNG